MLSARWAAALLWVPALCVVPAISALPGVAHAQTPPTPLPSPDAPEAPKTAAPKASGPTTAIPNADEPELMRYPPSSVRLPLIIGGSFVTLAAYGLSVASARTWDDVPGADALHIPIAGPWIALAQNDCAPDDPDCGAILWLRGILYLVDGFAQLGGVGLIAEGIFMTTEADGPAPAEAPKTSWSVAPMITPTQTGGSIVGTF